MKLIVTIDTEEDNWNRYSRNENSCKNIEQLLALQELFDSYRVVPTYLVTLPVVNNEKSQSILKRIITGGLCEIGMHCHPWNTPPFDEPFIKKNTMLSNLPEKLILKKLSTLHFTIQEKFGVSPVSFRSGRYGFNEHVAQALEKINYRIDTSITPFEDQSQYLGPDFSGYSPWPYRFSSNNIFKPDTHGKLIEIPISTGFLQKNFFFYNRLLKFLQKRSFITRFRVIGIMNALRLLNKVSLNPERFNEYEMIALAKVLRSKGVNVLNCTFHSTSLKAGLSPFTKTELDEQRIFNRIKAFLKFINDEGIESVGISDAAKDL